MDELNVVDVPIDNPVGYPGKPLLDQRAMLRLFKGDHALRLIKVRQGTRSRIPQTAFGYDAFCGESTASLFRHRAHILGEGLVGCTAREGAPSQALSPSDVIE
jgi:hypothetical protein